MPAASPPRILVAERSPTVGLAIAAWLRGQGMHAEAVRSEAAAQAALAGSAYDLLIADAAMTALASLPIPRLTLVAPGATIPGPTLTRPVQPDALHAAVAALLAIPAAGPDLAGIAELWGAHDSPAFRRIALVFLAEAPARLAALAAAHMAGDRARMSHEAHALAGAALNVGLPEVVRLARAIEHAAPDAALAAIATEVEALRRTAAHDFDALRHLVAPA